MDWGEPINRERLASLFGEGLSHAEIGRVMGCSKNSIIGAARRQGLRRASPILRGGEYARRVIRAGAETLPPLPGPGLVREPWKPPSVSRGCRWPLWATGAAPTHVYCEAATPLDESWCPRHRAIAFVRPIARESSP